jgi:hypothetical protein
LSACHLVRHTLLLQKLSALEPSGDYVNWFCSYLTKRQSQVRVSGILSSPFAVLSGVPHGSVLGSLLFNIFMNDLCNVIKYSRYLLFADDIRIFRVIKSHNDCNRLQSVQGWCTANFMKLKLAKPELFPFSRKTNTLICDYKFCQSSITCTDSIKDLGVFIDSKFRFPNHVDYILSQCIKLLGLVRTLTFSFSSLDCLYMLYFTLVRSKTEYASVVWNSITTTDANKLERIQQKFAVLCRNLFLFMSITAMLRH